MSTTPARKRPKPPAFKAVVRNSSCTMEYMGSIEQGIEMSFYYIEDPAKRLAVIENLKAAHAKLLESGGQLNDSMG